MDRRWGGRAPEQGLIIVRPLLGLMPAARAILPRHGEDGPVTEERRIFDAPGSRIGGVKDIWCLSASPDGCEPGGFAVEVLLAGFLVISRSTLRLHRWQDSREVCRPTGAQGAGLGAGERAAVRGGVFRGGRVRIRACREGEAVKHGGGSERRTREDTGDAAAAVRLRFAGWFRGR